MKKAFITVLFFSTLFSQVFDYLYLPDTLGGCADLDNLIFNSVMNRIYIWSDRSDNIGVLDCATYERLKPIHSIPPDAHYLVSSRFIYNPNNNYLYVLSLRENNQFDKPPKKEYSLNNLSLTVTIDSFIYVIDCSTQVIIDTLNVDLINSYLSSPKAFDINLPANKIYLTLHTSPSTYESTYTYVIDARTNEVVKRFNSLPNIVHHKLRKIAYNFDAVYHGNPNAPLYVIDCENDTIVDSIPLPLGSEWDNAFIVSEIERFIIVRRDSVVIIDCTNNEIVSEIKIPNSAIYYFTYNSINNRLYIGASIGKTYIIDLNSNQIIDSLNLLAQLVYNPNSNHLFALSRSTSILVIDGATNQIIDEIQLPYELSINCGYVLNPTLNKLYLTDRFLLFTIDCNQRRLESCLKIAFVNQYMMFQPVTQRLYFNDICLDSFSSILTVYDANTFLPIKVLDLSDYVPYQEWFYHFTTATQVNKIYLTSGQSRGVYVLDGNTDSLFNYIPCNVGGHYLLYNPNQNKIYTIPFTSGLLPYDTLYIIDCENDEIRNKIYIGGSTGNGYFNLANDRVYFGFFDEDLREFKTMMIDGVGDTITKVIDSIGYQLAFRNKENIHQVYIGANSKDRIYVFDATKDSIIDSVIDVPVQSDCQFFYYDSLDDRIFYPLWSQTVVIDCSTNTIMETIPGGATGSFPETNFWNPVSNRLYTTTYHYPNKTWVDVIDCRTNTIIGSWFLLTVPTIMQWNPVNNVVFVMNHWRSKAVAIRDDLIGIKETKTVRTNNELFIYPTIGNRFIIKRKFDEEMKLYDVCGRVVRKIKKEEIVIDGKNLSPGVYFIRVDKPKTKNIQKFIVVK